MTAFADKIPKHQELEQEVVQRRRALEQRLPDLLAEVNQHIINPDKKIPAEPSCFRPPVLQFLIRGSPVD
jgi:hypothetical protein